MKLLPKLVITGIISVGLAMGSTGYFVISSIKTDMTASLTNRLAGDARFASARIMDKRDQIGGITEIVAQGRAIRKALVLFENSGVSQILNDQIAVYPFINYIVVTEVDGTVFSSSTRDGLGKRLNGEQLLSRQIKDNPMISNTPGDAFDGTPSGLLIGAVGIDPYLEIIGLKKRYSQWYSIGITNRGETIGRLVLSIDWSGIHEQLLEDVFDELVETGNPIDSVHITKSDYNMLCCNPNQKKGAIPLPPSNQKIFFGQNKMTEEISLDFGVDNYLVIVSYDQLQALKPIKDAIRFVIFATSIGSLFLGLMIFVLMRKTILTRIDVLSDATRKIGAGDLTYTIEDLGGDEIGSLGLSINEMVSNLNLKTISIDQLNTEISLKNKALVDLKEQTGLAEASARAKSEFLASMSHEIRTPMNGVLGMLGLIENTRLDERQSQQVRLAQTSAQSLLGIINDILDFTKIEAGKVDLEEIDFDLQVLLEEFSKTQALRATEKGLELIIDTRKMTASSVYGDPGRVRQILNNLVGNALKFTSEGEILLTGAIQENNTSDVIFSCSIKDTGIGISEDKQIQLFDAFTQADSSTTRNYGGTGLGLSITKQLCELMNGGIRVSSELNVGSLFEFFVVLKAGKQTKKEPIDIEIGKLKVLVVDDNATNREVLKGQLAQWGVIVDEAPSAAIALKILNSQPTTPFDIALLDMEMPNMDGAELGKIIRENRHLDSLKLVMMSSISHRGDRKYFTDIGFQAYFPKPLSASDLKAGMSVVSGLTYQEDLENNREIITTHYLREAGIKSAPGHSQDPIKKAAYEGCKVLLVEDNLINQEVAKGILESLGLYIDVAVNGSDALNALNKQKVKPFQLILMDCQMPIMDGYETTAAIRNGRAGKVNMTIPIIAMTANAMKGDKEKCLAAGMTDYISKPIDAADLKNALQLHLKSRNPAPEFDGPPSNSGESTVKLVWDRERYFDVMRNPARAQKIISLFIDSVPSEIESLGNAVADREINRVSSIAHRLKGSVANIYGEQLAEALSKLEMKAIDRQLDSFDETLKEIERCAQCLLDELSKV